MLIVVADDLPKTALELLKAEGWEVDSKSGRSPEELSKDIAAADALVVRSATKVTPDIIAGGKKLKAIARAGTGVDNVNVGAATARGIVVMNAPGANSISVAELAMAQLLSMARKLPAADASMKQGKWDKKSFLGEEVRGKVLGLAGLGRIGQEVARRAQSFEMTVIAHDPFIASNIAAGLNIELVSLDELCARADYLSLHMPATPQTRHTFNAERLAKCKKGLKLINTARGELIDEPALVEAIKSGHIGGAALDVYTTEPTTDHTLQQLPQVVASPHIAASTKEGQELVGVETATALRDFLKTGVIRNAVNFPSIPAEEFQKIQPFVDLAKQLGSLVGQMGEARIEGLSVRYYGELASGTHPLIVNAALVGLFKAILHDETVTEVNARAVAKARGIELTESSSTRGRSFRSLISLKLMTSTGERYVEGTIVPGFGPRLVLLNGVPIDAELPGTTILFMNNDQPGVIGQIGTILGQNHINIANFALGRNESGAVCAANVDEPADKKIGEDVMKQIRALKPVKNAWLVRV
ncbi:MAG: phosphoglycerate dehydrogenase [Cyanobacteria bacterium]|nr:phosphoglycerate dehydrogenase [Cyanobacteriota bacterium]